MLRCTKCGLDKPREDFYDSSISVDGRRGRCKECTKASVKENRIANAEYYHAYDRQRADDPARVALRQRVALNRRLDPEKRQADWERGNRWRDRNFVKRRAHIMVGNAIRDGILARPTACSRCGGECTPNAHHENYYHPLEVTWLCDDCHGLRHREINEEIRSGADLRCRGFDLAPKQDAQVSEELLVTLEVQA